ncbi:HisJ family histidinol phosphate phosphatase [Parabacteroides sp. PF5-5]|uniref:histidinol-phosphatase n=1 Tax=unclassified Parabacteroides TaxID=2649774 RepID=UPI002473EF91|nr:MULTISPECIES: histidinol-phosphatase [unclassified Parabacteroides]MDH6304159.1 HisJ family histidinol phosphate phosphatase [Parabacteroides sp. PH5-39]MDH6315125.1 HisJ family histidinol phosphate phosphatase [Parabacteroides sp. PF5-13]MDH6318786.1 HisJ family histidinol phosphate phosphatase [Parabacteroides sp. PH5-13]MDH6322515.1 HisJ family histidinol phosphate phosphatase [Parabacteroides sp. PH5-8]MDH6326349.1 HisJ family histidinol phosphate phosphatase [Parabacteroides sp. PH5-41
MLLSNYHSHCTFCDGRSAPEDFVKFAVSKGFSTYGFSSHSPLPFETFWNMSDTDLPEYLAEIERLRKKYEDKLKIYVALEIDYLDETFNASIPYFKELPLDYRIGSVHFLPISKELTEANMVCIDGSFEDYKNAVNTHFGGSIRKLAERFYDSAMKMVEAGGIDIVGHIDKVYMNGQRIDSSLIDAPWYKDLFISCLDLIAEKGIMVEINTKNMSRKGETFPHVNYLSLLKERNIPVLVNSDCHFPDLVNDGRSEAFQLLKETGFRTTRELINGKWNDVPFSVY